MIDSPVSDALSRFLDLDVARYKLIGSNLANIDTPGYRTRDLDFRAELARARGRGEGNHAVVLHEAWFAPVARPVRGLMERPDGNNVSLERETLLLAEAQLKYNLGVQLIKAHFHGISLAISGGGTSA